jgi:hypothetical protein
LFEIENAFDLNLNLGFKFKFAKKKNQKAISILLWGPRPNRPIHPVTHPNFFSIFLLHFTQPIWHLAHLSLLAHPGPRIASSPTSHSRAMLRHRL